MYMNKIRGTGNTYKSKEREMPLVGIIAKKKDILAIKKDVEKENIEIIEITRESITNMKNIKFEEIIILKDIELQTEEYKYMKEIISKVQYLIINEDIEMNVLKKMQMEKPIKVITFGFNSKSTITISSVKEEKIIICIQRNIEKMNGYIIEEQEKEIKIDEGNNKKIYNELAKFIIKELHN